MEVRYLSFSFPADNGNSVVKNWNREKTLWISRNETDAFALDLASTSKSDFAVAV